MSDPEPELVIHPREGTPAITDTPEDLAIAVEELSSSHMPVGVDVERAAGFRYSDRAYLIQIRREDVGTYLIDAGALPDLTELSSALAQAPWILHAADQDLKSLRMAGLHVPELFDTEIAAQMLGLERIGLAAVCEYMLGLTLDKNHQNSDWSVRPLPHSWLRYAALDVELLPELYRALGQALYAAERWDWAVAEFEYIRTRPDKQPDPNRWRTIPGAGKIRKRRHLAILEELWHEREQIAAEKDIAPTRLIRNRTLVSIALDPPRNRRGLLSIQEMRRSRTRTHTDRWLKAIARGQARSRDDLPPLHRPLAPGEHPRVQQWRNTYPDAHARLQKIRQVVHARASQLHMDPIMLLEPRVQRLIAWNNIAYQGAELNAYLSRLGVRDWQIENIGHDIEKVIRSF
ncbi:MAG: HRDC domain-containing protein [Actinomycetaceae bacterium]|nr:HRDC domain-containing protein [Actinomycetaceae bacterium]